MTTMASQITSLTVVYSMVYSGADQRKHQSSASLAFVRGIHRRPVNSPHKWPVTRKMFPFDDVIMLKFAVLIDISCIVYFVYLKFKWNLRHVIFKQILVIDGWGITGLRWWSMILCQTGKLLSSKTSSVKIPRGPFYSQYELTLIPVWINNHIHHKV